MRCEPVELSADENRSQIMNRETKQTNKVRNMKGIRPGGGSAGRAKGSAVEKRLTAGEPSRFTGFGDVGRACDKWLMENDPLFRKMREKRAEEDFQRHGRRLAEADKAENL